MELVGLLAASAASVWILNALFPDASDTSVRPLLSSIFSFSARIMSSCGKKVHWIVFSIRLLPKVST